MSACERCGVSTVGDLDRWDRHAGGTVCGKCLTAPEAAKADAEAEVEWFERRGLPVPAEVAA